MAYSTGTQTINFVLLADFNAGVMTTYYPAYSYCEKAAIGKTINLKTVMD